MLLSFIKTLDAAFGSLKKRKSKDSTKNENTCIDTDDARGKKSPQFNFENVNICPNLAD